MIPQTENDLRQDFSFESLPDKTFRLHPDTDRVAGTVEQIQALQQTIYLILNTERYEWLIHSWDYGVELQDLIGKDTEYCMPEIERRIRDALMQDDRIQDVRDFAFTVEKKKVHTAFTVVTIYGELQSEKEVQI